MKTCSKCKTLKADDAFNKNRSTKSGLQDWCKKCFSDGAKTKWRKLTFAERTRKGSKVRRFLLKQKYGLTLEIYESMLRAQSNQCCICKCLLKFSGHRTTATACVDHCHETKRVRGILCNGCNITIGKFRDSAALLREAADYLDSTNINKTQ